MTNSRKICKSHRNYIDDGSIDKNSYLDNESNDAKQSRGKSKLKIACLNVRSLYNKVDQLHVLVDNHQFDIVCVNETWLDDSIDNAEISIPSYSIVRKDRNRNGGGVCFYVKDTIQYRFENDQFGNAIESLWLSVKQKHYYLVIGTIYRPPNSNSEYHSNILNEIQRAKDFSEHVLVLGDLSYDCCKN